MNAFVASSLAVVIAAQQAAPSNAPSQQAGEARTWTTADDHRNMMEQLGIKALRPGPSGNEQAPNKIEKMPCVNVSLLDGQLAWRQHDGGHTDGPNWKARLSVVCTSWRTPYRGFSLLDLHDPTTWTGCERRRGSVRRSARCR